MRAYACVCLFVCVKVCVCVRMRLCVHLCVRRKQGVRSYEGVKLACSGLNIVGFKTPHGFNLGLIKSK